MRIGCLRKPVGVQLRVTGYPNANSVRIALSDAAVASHVPPVPTSCDDVSDTSVQLSAGVWVGFGSHSARPWSTRCANVSHATL